MNNDEFYTQMETIERELSYYKKNFKDKVVYCNSDHYKYSSFFKYFKDNFKSFGLKKLIATNYSKNNNGYKAVYDGISLHIERLKEDGDFRSQESIELLKEADLVITNPPFSLFREYIAQLINYKKDFIVLGNINAVTYIDIFPYIRDQKILAGVNFNVSESFLVPMEYSKIIKTKLNSKGQLVSTIPNIAWYTTLNHNVEKYIKLTKSFNEEDYKKYDNYDAIEVSKVGDIPKNYEGVMGVPVNFLKDYNPKQFKILGSNRGIKQDNTGYFGRSTYIDGKETYKRIFIKKIT